MKKHTAIAVCFCAGGLLQLFFDLFIKFFNLFKVIISFKPVNLLDRNHIFVISLRKLNRFSGSFGFRNQRIVFVSDETE